MIVVREAEGTLVTQTGKVAAEIAPKTSLKLSGATPRSP